MMQTQYNAYNQMSLRDLLREPEEELQHWLDTKSKEVQEGLKRWLNKEV